MASWAGSVRFRIAQQEPANALSEVIYDLRC
jgi:hypothetical protein